MHARRRYDSPMPEPAPSAEHQRLQEEASRQQNWKRWGPYLAERQWGTVREDYSEYGSAWEYFPHDHARSRAYRWGEDGLLGWTDRECRLCFAVALWNGRDPFLKERLFGVTNPQGNHGEDVKELYFYLDSTPTHSYAKALYKYPHARFPYDELIEESARRSRREPEYEVTDTGVFDGGRYFDVLAEYANAAPDDTLIRLTFTNRGPEPAELHALPTLWFRNSWVWGCKHEGCTLRPNIAIGAPNRLDTDHETLGRFSLALEPRPDLPAPELLFTENYTNTPRLYNYAAFGDYVKDAFHRRVVDGDASAVNPKNYGTKFAAWHRLRLAPGESVTLRLRLFPTAEAPKEPFGTGFDDLFKRRIAEADAFYANVIPQGLSDDQKATVRQAYAGLLWSKQFYHYVVRDWLDGDPAMPSPPEHRKVGRNSDWPHLFTRDILSMPDKWEYPWFAAWDTAFHMLPLSDVDGHEAKRQLMLLLREWYMHPNGQLPAYEFAFDDVNPPVHAYACFRAYKICGKMQPGVGRDRRFLASTFQKLLLNFTWWVNRKDPTGRHVFAGGFLGLDNIGPFDRNAPLGDGAILNQADGTAWMAFYALTMLSIALELAREQPEYEDMASKFFEHFIAIVDAMNELGGSGLWNEEDGFYYDQLRVNGDSVPVRLRSLVGLIPLIAVGVISEAQIEPLEGFRKRTAWFLTHRHDLARHVTLLEGAGGPGGQSDQLLLAVPSRKRLERVLRYLLDEDEFLSPFGIRSLSKFHEANPLRFEHRGASYEVRYEPGESQSDVFGGNSNWRGPIWFPVNYLIVEALQRYHHAYGDDFKIECPTGSGHLATLGEVALEIERRLARLFEPDADGRRPCDGRAAELFARPDFAGLRQFHEYFHADTGEGLGASHQTGWTALITRIYADLANQRH